MHKKNILSLVVVLLFFLVIFVFIYYSPINSGFGVIKYIDIGSNKVKVELALTPGEQAQGLSGRSGLNENEGMLFVFGVPGKYDFWMKDMNFALDIIWLSEDLHIVYIKKDARPESYPAIFGPEMDTKYVLEVVSGFASRYNLKTGDSIYFSQQ